MKRLANKCRACHGEECLGGGNLRCVQRDPHPSILAGIIDSYGGIRFVVTHADELQNHVRCDELSVVVPNLLVHEPLAWGDNAVVVARIELCVEEWLNSRPNLDKVGHDAVTMYRIRQKRNPNRTIDLCEVCET